MKKIIIMLTTSHPQIDHRLSAVGREISIVVQPSDFIIDLRRKFKKVKNYKSFIAQ